MKIYPVKSPLLLFNWDLTPWLSQADCQGIAVGNYSFTIGGLKAEASSNFATSVFMLQG
jgi:hypothetical protein